MTVSQAVDIIVIGAGHNGLVAANYLTDAGRSVVVVEASDAIGGFTASRPIPEAPTHLAHPCSFDPFFWDSFPPAKELRLDKDGLQRVRVDPGLVYLDPEDASIGFWESPPDNGRGDREILQVRCPRIHGVLRAVACVQRRRAVVLRRQSLPVRCAPAGTNRGFCVEASPQARRNRLIG